MPGRDVLVDRICVDSQDIGQSGVTDLARAVCLCPFVFNLCHHRIAHVILRSSRVNNDVVKLLLRGMREVASAG